MGTDAPFASDVPEPRPGAAEGTEPEPSVDADAVIDQVPRDVLEAAKRAFSLRDRTASVLELLADSLLDERGAPGPRRLEFGKGAVRVMVTVHERARAVQLEVRAVQAEVLELQVGETTVAVEQTSDGGWTADVDHGLLSILVHAGSDRARTAWLRV